jgi:chromate transporter
VSEDPQTATDAARLPLARRCLALALAFGRVGLLGFGGGPSFIPLVQREVEGARWLTREGFLDAFAFGNALPGPIATKIAGYVGYRIAGWLGALAALLGLTLPTIVMMVALAALYAEHRDVPWVEGALLGLRPVVIALLVLTVVTFAPSALGPRSGWLRDPSRPLIALLAFAAALWGGVHPGLLILAGGALGMVLGRPR